MNTLKLPKGEDSSLSQFYLKRHKLTGAKSLEENWNDWKAEHTRVFTLKALDVSTERISQSKEVLVTYESMRK